MKKSIKIIFSENQQSFISKIIKILNNILLNDKKEENCFMEKTDNCLSKKEIGDLDFVINNINAEKELTLFNEEGAVFLMEDGCFSEDKTFKEKQNRFNDFQMILLKIKFGLIIVISGEKFKITTRKNDKIYLNSCKPEKYSFSNKNFIKFFNNRAGLQENILKIFKMTIRFFTQLNSAKKELIYP